MAESRRMVEDVGFDILPVPASLQKEDVGAAGIHTQEFGVFTGIEMSVSADETVVQGIQAVSGFFVFDLPGRFVIIKAVVGVA